jgi:hypothetical protein
MAFSFGSPGGPGAGQTEQIMSGADLPLIQTEVCKLTPFVSTSVLCISLISVFHLEHRIHLYSWRC